MSSREYESADLILKLYEMRREPVMREARGWMLGFFPESAQDIVQAVVNPQTSAYYRMTTSYWEMAASLVNNGAIDEKMFTDANAEHVMIFAKIQPHLAELRQMMNSPKMFQNLETLVMQMPDAEQMLEQRRQMIRRMMQARHEAARATQQG